MNYLQHLLDSKGRANLVSRAAMICRRFGLTRRKSRETLERILEITAKYAYKPSFFITADLLDHHSELIREITRNRTHVGLHGHHHIDHAQMSGTVQKYEIARGLEKFKACNIPVSGFRGPFLRFNADTAKAANDSGISWVTHSVMLLDHNARTASLTACSAVRHLLEDFYVQESHGATPSLPCWGPHCLEIPVSLPDDEVLVDRIQIHDPDELTAIWSSMLESTRQEGELFNLLFHPERIEFLAKPLDGLLEKANSYRDLWLCSLDDIAQWWKERATFSFEIKPPLPQTSNLGPQTSGVFQVTPRCNSTASIALQQPGGRTESIRPGTDGTFSVHSSFRPVIRISPGFCDKDTPCLTNDGFVVEHDGDPSRCSFALEGTCSKDIRQLLEAVKKAQGPLLRFARWPAGYRSAMAVSADVDAITLWDFVRRAWYFIRLPKAP